MKGKEHGLVHLAARVRLNVGKFGAEELLGAFDGQFFHDVDILAAAIIALARIAFGIFVGEDGTLRFENSARNDVFRGNQLDFMALTTEFVADCSENLGIDILEACIEENVGRRVLGGGVGLRHVSHPPG